MHRLRELTVVGDGSLEPPPDRRSLLNTFRAQIRAHFAAEEDPEYFGTLASVSPRLAVQIAQLRLEHAEFLLAADSLLRAIDEGCSRQAFAATLKQLLDRFAAHERTETLLLQEFFDRTGEPMPE
jgi:hypothetical protein